MGRRGYWSGYFDAEIGVDDPPRCSMDDVDCRRQQRDYEDGQEAFQREQAEQRRAREVRQRREEEERALEQQYWEEEQRRSAAAEYYRQLEEKMYEEARRADYPDNPADPATAGNDG